MLKKILFSLLLLCIFLPIVNGLCALGERVAYGTFWGKDRPKGLYIHQNGQRPRLKPNVDLNGWLYDISINSIGFRGDDLVTPKPVNGFRIWCMGGSTTFDIFSDRNEHTWPAQVQSILQIQFPDRTIEVLNAGVPGEDLLGSTQDFERLQSSIKADVVIIYHGPNDMRQIMSNPTLQQQRPNGSPTLPPLEPDATTLQGLLNRNQDLAFIRVFRRIFKNKRNIPSTWEANKFKPADIHELQFRLLETIQKVRRLGAIPILATHALRAQPDDIGPQVVDRVAETAWLLRMTPENALNAFDQYNTMVRELAQQQGLALADVRSVVGPETENWGDATHFYPSGSKLAAQEVANSIIPLLQSR